MPASRSARATIFTPRSWPSSPTLAISTRIGGAMAANCTVLPSAHPMTSDPGFFRDLAWVIVAAVAGGALAWLARQPLILGYVVGGILVGRFTPGPTVSDTHTFELFAEIGVVLLMFSVGIEFSLRDLLRVRWVALLGGPLGIVLTAALGAGAGGVLGWPPGQGLAVVLAVGLGTGALTQAVGLSVALGAFLAGLIISTSDYAHETIARLLPLRDVFVAMFFVTVGMLVDPFTVAANLPLLAALIVLIVVGKAVIRSAIVRLFGYPWSTAARVGVGLAQIGEFSFILVQVARGARLVGDDVYNATLAASLFSILFNALLVRHVPDWLDALWHFRARGPSVAESTRAGGVVLCGFGRVGSEIGEALETFEIPYAVIERDPDICAQLRARGVPCVFGDAAHRELLARAGVARAPLVTVALPEIERARLAVAAVRALRADVPLLARAHGRAEAEALRAKGATEIIQPEPEASATSPRSEEHTSELQSPDHLVCRLLLEKKKH